MKFLLVTLGLLMSVACGRVVYGLGTFCIVVRTNWRHFDSVRCLLGNILWEEGNWKQKRMRISIFLLETSQYGDHAYESYLESLADDLNQREMELSHHRTSKVSVVLPPRNLSSTGNRSLLYYRYTDWATEHIVLEPENKCEYVLYTDGDSYYTSRWFHFMLRGAWQNLELILFSYLTRNTGGIYTNMVIPTLGFEDLILGAGAIRVAAIRRTGARLLPKGEETELGMVSRETFFFQKIADNLTDDSIDVLPYAFLVLP